MDKIVVYKVTVLYDFVRYGYFMEGSNDFTECNYIYIVVLNIINDNFGLVKS